MQQGGGRRWLGLVARPLLVLIAAGVFGWWLLRGERARRPSAEPEPAAPAVAGPHARAWAPREQRDPAPGCAPEAATTCVDGDVWWVDSCEQTYALATECGDRRCAAGACAQPSPGGCGDVSALGSCDRDLARICQVDRVVEIDCGATEQRCVMTGEGPVCRDRSADDCAPDTAPRCAGDTLRTCEDGRWRTFDCAALGGMCVPPRGREGPRCVFALPRADPQCGACGCPPEPSLEVCDGRDNDLDGAVDEDAPCLPVPVVAFVVGGEGEGSYTDDDVRTAIAELDVAFARDDGLGIAFELRDIVRLADDELLEIDMRDVDRMLTAGVLKVASEDFYVPVVFTDVVLAEGVPRPGISTVPNGMCGGLRRVWQRQPPVGIVAIAKERWPTTLAHEMGHFLGLCHTHEAPPPVQRVAEGSELADAPVCDARCPDDDDGICDTATDPGPERCATDEQCLVHCLGGDRPDPRNMMAYYPECRSMFSEEQTLLMRRSLALRRGWHACTQSSEGCVCDPALGSCPEEMTCRPYVGGAEAGTNWRCDLDGAALPGGTCKAGGECGNGSICVHTPDGAGHCARTCMPGVTACKCESIDSPAVAVCTEDLRFDSAP